MCVCVCVCVCTATDALMSVCVQCHIVCPRAFCYPRRYLFDTAVVAATTPSRGGPVSTHGAVRRVLCIYRSLLQCDY